MFNFGKMNNSYKSYQIYLIKAIVTTLLLIPILSFANNNKSRLWQIDKPGLAASYILATMHSEDPRILKLPEKYRRLFTKSKSFTAEIDLSIDNSQELMKTMMLPNNKKLKGIIGEELFQKSKVILNDFGLPEKMVNQMKPWAVLMTISYPKPKTGLFLDKILFDEAIKAKKKCYGLETAQEQIALFDNISYLHQTILLRDSILLYPKFENQLEKLTVLYLDGDLEGLLSYNNEIMRLGNYRVAKKFMNKLIDSRNRTMVQRMQARLREGNAFIAVGALHLPGESGIIQLLRSRNFQLTAIQ